MAWPHFELPKWMNKVQQSMIERMGWLAMRPIIGAIGKMLGLPPPALRPWLSGAAEDGETILNAYSTALLPRPGDWPENVEVTGYWFLDPPAGWQPPEDLLRFLKAGGPPLYVGFGSMIMKDPQATLDIVLESIRAIGCRAVIGAGWSGMRLQNLPENVFAIEAAPHDWLFPRMAAIVHHGGAGTTGAALRAGVP